MSDPRPVEGSRDNPSFPPWPEPVDRWTVAELAQLMGELDAYPEDSPAIVRNALQVAAILAAGAGLAWERHVRDCVTLADARAGLLEIWDLLVRADAASLGVTLRNRRAARAAFQGVHSSPKVGFFVTRDASEGDPRPGRGGGYGQIVAAVADARARLSLLADDRRERDLAPYLHDPWCPEPSQEPRVPDKDDWYSPLVQAVDRAVDAADAGSPDADAFRNLLATLQDLFPGTTPPDVSVCGKGPGPALRNASSWTPARQILAHVRAVSPNTPGLDRLERAIGRAAGAAHRRDGESREALDGARAIPAPPVVAADCRIVLATGGARTFPTGFRSEEVAAGAGSLHLPDEGHLMTIGPTGSGKTTCTIIPAVLRYPGPLVVVDPKGEIEAVTRRYRERLGYPVWSIRPDSAGSDRINPLETVDRSNLVAECGRLANLLSAVGLVPGHRDPFWDQSALAVLSGYVAHAVADRDCDPAAIPEAATLGDYPLPRNMPQAARIARWSVVARARAAMYGVLGDTGGSDESRMTESIRGVYAHHVRWLHDPAAARVLGPSTIDLRRVRAGLPYTLYVAAPTAHAEVQRPLLRTIIGSLLGLLQQRTTRPALNTLLLVDETHLLGEFEPLRTAITTLRSYGVQVWTCWQHVAQIEHAWQDWPTLVGNARILFQCGSPHPYDLPGHPACPPPTPTAVHPISVSIQGGTPATLQARPYYADPALAGRAPSRQPGRQDPASGRRGRRPQSMSDGSSPAPP